jgi:hypothetical protein
MVLVIEAWDTGGTHILSGPIDFAQKTGAKALSATIRIRSFGKSQGATLELALFDERGSKKLASFGRMTLDGSGAWREHSGRNVTVEASERPFRLALVVSGPQENARLEVDQVGLFEGAELGPVTDNSDLAVIEAEDMADGTAWKAVDDYPGWYNGTPSGMKMLAGFEAIKPEQNRHAIRPVAVHQQFPAMHEARKNGGCC